MDYEQIVDNLVAAGKPSESWQSADGTRLLILPEGGRILGLFTATDAANFLWTHPDLESPETASRVFKTDDWQNPGGDRTWLAPEVDFFLPVYPDCHHYRVQPDLDPGHYKVVRENGVITLVNRATLNLSRHKKPIRVTISKSAGPTLNPLHHEASHLSRIAYAGYSLCSTLHLDDATDEPIAVGLWNLLQLPHGGEMIVPTSARTEPKIYVGDVSANDLAVTERLVRYRMRASGEQKIGIRATATTGRVGYIWSAGNQAALVIRNFNVNQAGQYVDVHWKEPDAPGTAFQACNVNNILGAFSEMEYHVPAIGPRLNSSSCDDESQVWAFRGSAKEIMSVALRLLTPSL